MRKDKLTRAQVNEYYAQYRDGDKEAIVPIVMDTAIIVHSKCRNWRTPKDECISIAYDIVCRAIQGYDPQMEASFSSYLYNAVFFGVGLHFRNTHKVYSKELTVWNDGEELNEAPNEVEDRYTEELDRIKSVCLEIAKEDGNRNLLRTMELFLEGYNFTEIANIIGISSQGAVTHYNKIVKLAKAKLK